MLFMYPCVKDFWCSRYFRYPPAPVCLAFKCNLFLQYLLPLMRTMSLYPFFPGDFAFQLSMPFPFLTKEMLPTAPLLYFTTLHFTSLLFPLHFFTSIHLTLYPCFSTLYTVQLMCCAICILCNVLILPCAIPPAHHSLYTVHYALCTVHRLHCALCTVCSRVHHVFFTQHHAQCTVPYVLYVLCLFALCAPECIVPYALQNLHFALCTVHCQ